MWSFVHISDPHLASTRDGEWNNKFLCTMMPDVMECLRRDLKEISPDFALITGDVVSVQTREGVFAARDELNKLGIRYYPMGGNHDFISLESRAWFLEAYKDVLPEPRTHYTFLHKGLRVCALDAWWHMTDGSLSPVAPPKAVETMDIELKDMYWDIPPEQLDWLDRILTDDPVSPTMVSLHYPAIGAPDRLLHPEFRNGGGLEHGDELLSVMERHNNARVLFTGHVHAHFIERAGHVTQISTGALPEYPVEYRVVKVFEDRLEVETRGLSDSSFAQRSLIPGHEYTAGLQQDRETIILLR